MRVAIHSIKKTLFQGEVYSLNVQSTTGEITILPHHHPLITQLIPGLVRIVDAKGELTTLAINSGFLEVGKKDATILCQI